LKSQLFQLCFLMVVGLKSRLLLVANAATFLFSTHGTMFLPSIRSAALAFAPRPTLHHSSSLVQRSSINRVAVSVRWMSSEDQKDGSVAAQEERSEEELAAIKAAREARK
jgi:hypothetical protein